jgi:hypothetical protein
MFFSKRKRKNDDPPPFPAWILVLIALGLVMFIAVFFPFSVRQTSPSAPNAPQGNIELTATYIVQQATAMAQVTPRPAQISTLDPLEMTATAIIGWATESVLQSGSK